MSKTILSGHTSPETAYLVEDYPYGFRLRCRIRYWLDCDSKRGARLMSQTSNPKLSGLVWNKPKASTFARFGGCMFLDEAGHVQWAGLTEYTGGKEASAWLAEYSAGVPASLLKTARGWVAAKVAFDDARAAGATEGEAIIACRRAVAIVND